MTFTKHETFGYSNNGKEFLVGQGQSYSAVQDSIAAGTAFGETYKGTSARILAGVNGNTALGMYDNRSLSKDINTGWAPTKTGMLSDVLDLWGMSDVSDTAT